MTRAKRGMTDVNHTVQPDTAMTVKGWDLRWQHGGPFCHCTPYSALRSKSPGGLGFHITGQLVPTYAPTCDVDRTFSPRQSSPI